MEAGGAQKASLELARGLKERGHRLVVVTMYDKGQYIPTFEKEYGLSIINLQMKPNDKGHVGRLLVFIRGLFRLYRICQTKQIQVMQTFTRYSNIIGPLVGWIAGVPIRVSSQRTTQLGVSRWVHRLDRWVANSRLVHKMTAVSEGTRQFSIEIEKIQPKKLQVIPNGIDVTKYQSALTNQPALCTELGLKMTDIIILTVARLHPQKGHQYLLDAVPLVHNQFSNAHFLFVGKGELQREIEQKIQNMGLESHVHLLGVRRDIPHLLALSHLFVLPSLWEGMPNVLLEAMAAKVPVIATNVDGSPEIVVHEETGVLVPPRDSMALAKTMNALLQSSHKANELKEESYKRVQNHFSLEKTISAYELLYQTFL